MSLKLNLIAAVCENMGIGKNNDLPWRLKSEMAYFTRMTSESKNNKKNVVIMGRKTWDSIPPKYKPLNNRINFILSRSNVYLDGYKDCFAFKSLDEAIDKLNNKDYQKIYDNVWVIGGSLIYKASMANKYFYRLYLTEIKKQYDCDTYFPKLNGNLKEVKDDCVPEEVQEENGISFVYKIYENIDYKEE
nr:dihydrofolate reductase [Onthophagus taurus]